MVVTSLTDENMANLGLSPTSRFVVQIQPKFWSHYQFLFYETREGNFA